MTKVKKLEKSITTDSHARSEAATWVKNHGDDIIKVGKDLAKMEASLEKEELELEKVRDSLKGEFPSIRCYETISGLIRILRANRKNRGLLNAD